MTVRDILIKDLDAAAVQRLERRAAANGRSLEEEIRSLLTEGVERMESILGELEAFGNKLDQAEAEMEQRHKENDARLDALRRKHGRPPGASS